MKVRREISSIPLRTAEGTWETFVELVTGHETVDGGQLSAAATVMASLITDEAFKDHSLTMTGVSHRLVVYLLHGLDAMEAGYDVDNLTWNPTAGDWQLFIPCPEEDFDWAKRVLAERAPRFFVIKPGEAIGQHEDDNLAQKSDGLSVSWEVFDE
ncbi:MAG: hypothetical protein MI806_22445 [Minwuiales bacterium]|nr:hypothetical protein [Minwuiales bacterium]